MGWGEGDCTAPDRTAPCHASLRLTLPFLAWPCRCLMHRIAPPRTGPHCTALPRTTLKIFTCHTYLYTLLVGACLGMGGNVGTYSYVGYGYGGNYGGNVGTYSYVFSVGGLSEGVPSYVSGTYALRPLHTA